MKTTHPFKVDIQLDFTSLGEIGFLNKKHVPMGQLQLNFPSFQLVGEISAV
jgi:hypothetical protein